MTISTKHYMDLKFAISDCLQRRNWSTLFELCGTNDSEISKTIAAIFSLYDAKNEWNFIDYILTLKSEERLHKWESVATVCYVLGKIGMENTKNAVANLKIFLSENHMLRTAAIAALSNLWVMNCRSAEKAIFDFWILKSGGNEELEEVAVKSCEYLAANRPEMVTAFLKKASRLTRKEAASESAKEMISKYLAPKEDEKTGKSRVKKKIQIKRRKSK